MVEGKAYFRALGNSCQENSKIWLCLYRPSETERKDVLGMFQIRRNKGDSKIVHSWVGNE